MSTSTVLVDLVKSMMTLIRMPRGIIVTPTAVPKAMAEALGHPTSMTVKFNPNSLTMLSTAGWTTSVKIVTVAFNPIKPIPTRRPPFKARRNGTRMHTPMSVIKIGIMTVGPRSIIN